MKVWEKICHEYLNSCNKTNKQGIEHVAIAFAIVIEERSRPARVWFKLNIYARKSFFCTYFLLNPSHHLWTLTERLTRGDCCKSAGQDHCYLLD